MHELKARKQEQGDKVNSEQRVIDPADGGFMVEALNLGSGGTSDGVAVPEARKQEQGDKVNSEQRIIDPADGGMMIEAVNPGSGGASATRWP